MSDDIIEMARQAWADSGEGWVVKGWFEDRARALEAFAKLVEKRKCEELARKIEAMPFGTTGESFAVWIREQA